MVIVIIVSVVVFVASWLCTSKDVLSNFEQSDRHQAYGSYKCDNHRNGVERDTNP